MKKRKIIPVVALASCLLLGSIATLLTSCNESQKPVDVAVTSVSLALSKTTIKVGETSTATVTINPTGATNKKYTLASSKTEVATISGSTITAVSAGTTTIKVTTEDGSKTDEVTLTVEAVTTTIDVTSVTLALSKEELAIGEEATATIDILPSNATNKKYSLTASDVSVAKVEGLKITALKAGTTKIKVVTEDGSKTAEKTLTVLAPVVKAPVLTNPGETKFTVVAGENLTLPAITAKSSSDFDLTSAIQVEDFNDPSSVVKGVFNSKIAGLHTINYYVEDPTDATKTAELNLEVTVTPVTAEDFEVTGFSDPAALGTYGTFKENFEKGTDSPLYKGVNDSNHATSLSSTSDAISGNSLIMDMNKTAGSAANSVFLTSFTKAFLREKSVTYEVSFKYRVLTDNDNTGDVYFGLSWDGSNGINKQFVADKTVNKVNEYKTTFTEATIPAAGNAYFFFFKLGGSALDCKIAVDSFTITAKKVAETTQVTPTSDQLLAVGGFTFNWKEKANTFGQGETTFVDNISDSTIKTTIKGAAAGTFGENVMHLTGTDGHLFNGLNGTNLLAGKNVKISFSYYAINDNAWKMIVMNAGAGATRVDPTLTVVDGALKTFVWETTLASGDDAINFYPAGNSAFDIYIGNMTVELVDAPVLPTDKTVNGHEVGYTVTQSSRSFGSEDKGFVVVTKDFATPATVSGEGIGETITKFAYKDATKNNTTEWYNPAQTQIENGHEYEMVITYFIESIPEGSRFMINFDNNVFLDLDAAIGYHKHTINWTATKNVDYFSFFMPDDSSNAIVYIASTVVKLTAIHN